MKKGMMVFATLLVLVSFTLVVSAGDKAPKEKRQDSDMRYFSKNSFYIYALGSTNSFDPPDYLWEELGVGTGTGFAPVLGVGFRFLNMGDVFFLNGEFDFSPQSYNLDYVADQKVNYYTLMLNAEGMFFGARGLSLYFGIGVSIAQIRDMYLWDPYASSDTANESITAMALELGVKYPITRSLFIRSGLRWIGEVYPGNSWYDEYGYEYDAESDYDRLNTSFTFGVEFHF